MDRFELEREETISQKNKLICKNMLIKSPLSMGMIVILYIMYFVCFFTDLSNSKFSFFSFDIFTLIKYGANYSDLVLFEN